MNAKKAPDRKPNEFQGSSNLSLIRELTRWDIKHYHTELTAIANELKNRISRKKILSTLFIICLIQSHILAAFSEHWFPFDEDEKEIRRQLSFCIKTHLTIMFIIGLLYFFNPLIPLVMFIAYSTITLNWAIACFKQTSKLINNP